MPALLLVILTCLGPVTPPLSRTLVAGTEAWRARRCDQAMPLFASIVEGHPDSAEAEPAANLLLDCLNLGERYDDMELWVERLLGEPRFATLRRKLPVLLPLQRQFARRKAEQLEHAGDYPGCARAYEAAVAGGAEPGDELLYDALLCYDRAGQRADAVRVGEALLRRWPRSSLAARTRQALDVWRREP